MSQTGTEPAPAGASAAADPYRFMPRLLPHLPSAGSEGLVLAIEGYGALGLGEPARELIPWLRQAGAEQDQLARAEEVLSRARSGKLSWRTCAGRLRRNLDALSQRGFQAEPVVDAWSRQEGLLELYRTFDGNYQVCAAASDGGRTWLPGLGDHCALAAGRKLDHREDELLVRPYLFDGLGLGYYFDRVYRATKHTFLGYSCSLYVVEPDPAALAVVLHLYDWRELLADPRVRIFCGPDCTRELQRAFESDDDLRLPAVVVQAPLWAREASPSPDEVVAQVDRRREARRQESHEEMEGLYGECDAEYWARRFGEALEGRSQPLRILTTVSRHTTFLQYSIRDAMTAFERLGCQTRLVSERSDHHTISELTFHRAVKELRPDLVFLLDHLRGSSKRRVPANVPLFTWDQDQLPHAINAKTVRTMGPLDVLAGISAGYCVSSLGCDERRVAAAVMPTDPDRFSAEPVAQEELAPHRCDISFVSHASQTPHQFHDEQRGQMPNEATRRILDGVYELALEARRQCPVMVRSRAKQVVSQAARDAGANPTEVFRDWLMNWYIWRLLERAFRHEALDWVAKWANDTDRVFHIYGRGWDGHASLHPFSRGVAHNEQELRCIYQASAINLQLIPSGFLHQRALDGLAAGGFFLARATPADYQHSPILRILERADALGIAVLDGVEDNELQAAVENYERVTGLECDVSDPECLPYLRAAGSYPCAASVFARFGEIAFTDAESFRDRAERFLSDTDERRAVASEMRCVVIDRFSYQGTMQRFLEFHRAHLERVAAETSTPSEVS